MINAKNAVIGTAPARHVFDFFANGMEVKIGKHIKTFSEKT